MVITREEPTVEVQVRLLQEESAENDRFETFTLVLTDAAGLAPPNMFFREAVVNIEDTRMQQLVFLLFSHIWLFSPVPRLSDIFGLQPGNELFLLLQLPALCFQKRTL